MAEPTVRALHLFSLDFRALTRNVQLLIAEPIARGLHLSFKGTNFKKTDSYG